LNFHDRARMLKALALHLKAHRKALYELVVPYWRHACGQSD
jgi:acyl-CoA reductase-like NAD-dependent aldehyde dehydrogenase